MNIKIKNFNSIPTNVINYTSVNNSTVLFQDCLDSKKNKAVIADEEQALMDDKKLYDSIKLKDIRFGSKEWDEYKQKMIFFPPLSAPIEVKKAWQEVKDSIPKEDEEAQHALLIRGATLLLEASLPEEFGLPKNFTLSTIDDYKTLFSNDVTNNEKIKEVYKNSSEEEKYDEFIRLIKNVEDKLDEALLKYQTYF